MVAVRSTHAAHDFRCPNGKTFYHNLSTRWEQNLSRKYRYGLTKILQQQRLYGNRGRASVLPVIARLAGPDDIVQRVGTAFGEGQNVVLG